MSCGGETVLGLANKLLRRTPSSRQLRERFYERFAGCTVIVHEGVDVEWLEGLHKQPGGGGHFRFDARRRPQGTPTPIEWVVHEVIRPLGLPLPLIVKVAADALYVRHLTRAGTTVHPAEILGIVSEIGSRYHARLEPQDEGFATERGMAVEDNDLDPLAGL